MKIHLFLANLTVERVNETYFYIPDPQSSFNITIGSDLQLYLHEEPYFDIQFAEFRSNPVYVKVTACRQNLQNIL